MSYRLGSASLLRRFEFRVRRRSSGDWAGRTLTAASVLARSLRAARLP
jgi:hypothetical protein